AMVRSGRVALSRALRLTRRLRSRAMRALPSFDGALAPVHQFMQGHGVHLLWAPVEDQGDIRHHVIYAAGDSAAPVFCKKPAMASAQPSRSATSRAATSCSVRVGWLM